MIKMIKIALDSSCLNAYGKLPLINKLQQLEKDQKVEFYVPSSVWVEQITTQSPKHLPNYLKRIKESIEILELATVGRARIGKARIGITERVSIINQINSICFPSLEWSDLSYSQITDVLSIEACIAFNIDYFLTLDKKHMIDRGRKKALEELGIKVRYGRDASFLKEISVRLAL